MLSSTTLDEDEVADIETFALESDPFAQKVLTTLQYRGEARSVFVTGTFARWEKKFRMQKSKDQNGETVFTLTAYLPAGTHHIRFLVDGEMIVTNQYLQTVDFTNSLVNYIEIAAKTPPAEETQPTAILPSEPVPIPGAETVVVDHGVSKPIDIRSSEQAPETSDKLSSTLEEVVPVAEKQDQHSQPIPIRGAESRQPQQSLPEQHSAPEPKPKKFLPRAKYTNEIPDILLHLDLYGEPHNPDYIRASKAIEHLPQPPSLPMFMTKSILNATTPHKDDASVLTMPNHTVINHLATSSIKSGVLATSSTTRYKKKVCNPIPSLYLNEKLIRFSFSQQSCTNQPPTTAKPYSTRRHRSSQPTPSTQRRELATFFHKQISTTKAIDFSKLPSFSFSRQKSNDVFHEHWSGSIIFW